MKILLAKLGLDVHNKGIVLVSNILKEEGMEVIYIGNAMPEEIVTKAAQEDVDVIGVSSLAGSHLTLGKELIDKVKQHNLFGTSIVIGGVFPPSDIPKLKELGFESVFITGSTSKEIIESVKGQETENARRCA